MKSKTQYQKLNGDVAAAMSAERKMDDFDIKILQQKRHEAEVKRSVYCLNITSLQDFVIFGHDRLEIRILEGQCRSAVKMR